MINESKTIREYFMLISFVGSIFFGIVGNFSGYYLMRFKNDSMTSNIVSGTISACFIMIFLALINKRYETIRNIVNN